MRREAWGAAFKADPPPDRLTPGHLTALRPPRLGPALPAPSISETPSLFRGGSTFGGLDLRVLASHAGRG